MYRCINQGGETRPQSLRMYKLFIGFRKLGEFPTIREAKKFAGDSHLFGCFSLIGGNYRDSWYVMNDKTIKIRAATAANQLIEL